MPYYIKDLDTKKYVGIRKNPGESCTVLHEPALPCFVGLPTQVRPLSGGDRIPTLWTLILYAAGCATHCMRVRGSKAVADHDSLLYTQ